MTYTTDQLQNVINSTACCVANVAHKALMAEMYNDPNAKYLFKEVIYLNNIICVLNRYINQDTNSKCLSTSDVSSIVETIDSICGCNCCSDINDIMKDI